MPSFLIAGIWSKLLPFGLVAVTLMAYFDLKPSRVAP